MRRFPILPVLMVLSAACLAQTALAKPRQQAAAGSGQGRARLEPSKSTGSTRLAAFRPESGTEARHAGTMTRRSGSSPYAGNAVHAGIGKVYGLQPLVRDGDATIYSADFLWRLGSQAYIPVGLSNWEGDLNLGLAGIDGTFSIFTIDTGIGYHARFGRSVAVPFGARLGWYEMKAEVSALGLASSTWKSSGKSLTPFLGLMYAPGPRVALGVESRVPVFIPNDRGDDGDDEDKDKEEDEKEGKRSRQYPSYHLFMITLAI